MTDSHLPRVLIVDDDPLILKVVATVLDMRDAYVVQTVTSADEALAAVDDQRPALVVTDVMMPGMDGFELTRELRRRPDLERLPIVLLTARDSSADRAEAEEAGGDAYLTKPFSPLELLDVIERLLAKS